MNSGASGSNERRRLSKAIRLSKASSLNSASGVSSSRKSSRPRALDNARGRLDFRELDTPEALFRLDAFDKRIAFDSLRRSFDPDAPLFIDYAQHVADYEGTDRAPVVLDR